MSDGQSNYTISENVSRSFGKDAQRNNILAAKIIANIVKTTLGPKGMDKMLVDSTGNIIVTNDGVTILEEMEIDHPAAKMMVDIAKTQESEVGDGTTTAVLLAGKLLENAERLLDKKIHPTVIIKGYRLAAQKALEILKNQSVKIQDRNVLKNIAITAMTGKGAEGNKEHLAELIVNAVDQVSNGQEVNSEDITLEKLKGESISDSELVSGIVLQKERANADMPLRVDNPKILLVDFPIELRNPDAEAKISVSTPEQLENFIESEEIYLKNMTDKIIALGAKAIFCQKGIDDVAQYYLAKSGIFACRRIPKSEMEKLARATSGKVISTLRDLSLETLGSAERVEEVKHGDESFVYIRGCSNPRAVSLILRGGSSHVLDEIERAITDGLGDVISAIKSGTIVAGGGAIEIELSKELNLFSRTLGGREQLAVQEFSLALESIPETLAENAGLDPLEVLTDLKKQHDIGLKFHGLNLFSDKIEDTLQAGIIEPIKVKIQAITSASEVATMILRIDDVLISKGSLQKAENHYSGMD
ncbi:thermosome subunit [Candidatus Pacearchaeota archaeon CG10_big_fil_rev_8_21_14_0_10_31_24]|nr:MAG: thermosome subunit [Candidatus Pacearchaeota archaeon CG10_big_fil_rev_8_21_14_0_10_31_24]